jgi:hypothetical protein
MSRYVLVTRFTCFSSNAAAGRFSSPKTDLKTALPGKLTFTDPEKIRETTRGKIGTLES